LGKNTNNMERKPWTSSVVEGPPMFINTMAVGPLEPGVVGETVALPLLHCELYADSIDVVGVVHVARFAARQKGARSAITIVSTTKKKKKEYRGLCSIDVLEARCSHLNNVARVKAWTNDGYCFSGNDN
jgi:hypothetical protein